MSLLAKLKSPGHIAEAVVHFNRAQDATDDGRSNVEISRAVFDGLNKIQTEWRLHQLDRVRQQINEVKAFQLMTIGLPQEARSTLLRSPELRSLVAFEPQVMNHDTLKHGAYRPDVEINPALVKAATEEHRKLGSAYHNLEHPANTETEDRVIKRAAELLYIVRSNISHGEKTPYGPDFAKRERDESVCAVVLPLQRILFDLLLDQPSAKLVTYGTLAPGKPNQRIIQDIPGTWERCTVRGSSSFLGGLPRFSWNPMGPECEAQIFLSQHLPGLWQQIDDFEGIASRRRLIPVNTSTGVGVANIYLGSNP